MDMLERAAVIAFACAAVGGCAENLCDSVQALPDDAVALTIGDSIAWWNSGECQSIADHASLGLGTRVTNLAKSGARMLRGTDDNSPIPQQAAGGANGANGAESSWQIVVVDGGGNDLNADCGCGACDHVLDALVTVDDSRGSAGGAGGAGGADGADVVGAATGAVPDLVDALHARGAHVLLVGYYPLRENAWYGFDRCDDALAELHRRYAAFAAMRDDVELFDFADVVTPAGTPDAYQIDHVHPTALGSQLIGDALAKRIAALTQ